MNTIVRDRLIYTLNDCGILAMSPKKQNELAEKLESEGFVPEDLAKLWRISKRANRTDKDAAASLAGLLRDSKAEIQLVLKRGRDESAYPGEGQMQHQAEKWEPEKDPIRAARMAYSLSVSDRKSNQQVADEVGCNFVDVPRLIEMGRELSRPDLGTHDKKKPPVDDRGHAERLDKFKREMRA